MYHSEIEKQQKPKDKYTFSSLLSHSHLETKQKASKISSVSLMADHGGFDGVDQEPISTTSFSQLLFSDDLVLGLDFDYYHQPFNNPSSSPHDEKPPKMLCFGNYQNNVFGHTTTTNITTPQKSGVTCSDSSSTSSGNNNNIVPSKSNKKRNGSATPVANQRNSKKKASDNNTSSTSTTGHAKPTKARKPKLGERITTLQQLVSPFGKTDTASVLHEAMGYIRFLHEQVQVLCSPYLQHHLPQGGEHGGEGDLKSRGLCLVPVACTVHVANNNGADFWSPLSSTTKAAASVNVNVKQ